MPQPDRQTEPPAVPNAPVLTYASQSAEPANLQWLVSAAGVYILAQAGANLATMIIQSRVYVVGLSLISHPAVFLYVVPEMLAFALAIGILLRRRMAMLILLALIPVYCVLEPLKDRGLSLNTYIFWQGILAPRAIAAFVALLLLYRHAGRAGVFGPRSTFCHVEDSDDLSWFMVPMALLCMAPVVEQLVGLALSPRPPALSGRDWMWFVGDTVLPALVAIPLLWRKYRVLPALAVLAFAAPLGMVSALLYGRPSSSAGLGRLVLYMGKPFIMGLVSAWIIFGVYRRVRGAGLGQK